LPLLSSLDVFTIKYIADTRSPKELATYYRTEDIKIGEDLSALPDCDVVLLAIPVGVRGRYIREFSRRGAAIFSEKPFAPDLESHNEFMRLSNKITCNYMRTCYSSIRQLRDIITSGTLGHVRAAYFSEGGILGATGVGKEHYRTKAELSGGGVLMETGCHTLSELTYVLGDYELSVHEAEVVSQGDLDVHVQAQLHATGNESFTIKLEIGLLKPLKNKCRIAFDKTIIEFDQADPRSTLRLRPIDGIKKVNWQLAPSTAWARTLYQAHYLKWKMFLDKLLRKEEIDTKFETSVDTTRIITEIYEKARKGDSR
jgi:predicted dehydrogenase